MRRVAAFLLIAAVAVFAQGIIDHRGGTAGGGGAPTDAAYITQTPNGTLSAEQALSALATGILKSTTATGVVSIAVDADFPSTLTRDAEIDTFAELDAIVADATLGRALTHATDCTARTDGLAGDICVELDSDALFTCQPSAGDCDTAGEWIAVPAGSEVNNLETDGATGIADNEFFIGTGAGTGNYAALSGDVTSSNAGVVTIAANAVALTTDTTGNYAAGDAEAGAALTGDSATSFFAAGNLELARLPVGTANQLFKTNAGATAQEHATLAAEGGNEISVTFGVGTITLDVAEANLDLAAIGGTLGTGQADGAFILSSEIDTFSELDAIVADQTLVHSGSNIATATALAANPASTTGNYCADRNADGSCATQEDLDNLGGTAATAQIEDLAVTAGKIAKAARRKTLIVELFAPTADNATGDGKVYIPINSELDGHNIIAVEAWVVSTGTGGTLNVDLALCAATATGNACSGTVGDVLSTNLTVDENENKSTTAATAAVIDTAQDDLDTGEFIRIDVDAVHSTTAAKGLTITIVIEPE
jgi:hypothetical protein